MFENERFEYFLLTDLDLKFIFGHMFFVWDGNHMLHDDEPSWHISIDSIFLDTSHGLVELLTAMMEFNKYVLEPSFFSYITLDLNDCVITTLFISTSWWSWTT
jgi:hypothetical protein